MALCCVTNIAKGSDYDPIAVSISPAKIILTIEDDSYSDNDVEATIYYSTPGYSTIEVYNIEFLINGVAVDNATSLVKTCAGYYQARFDKKIIRAYAIANNLTGFTNVTVRGSITSKLLLNDSIVTKFFTGDGSIFFK
ncbi:MAG: hypothetical protein M0P97_02040 [Candidatus Moranbacteria bacterium]|nr:hypothetical protein [Candidatus Moranbacteria bacterium]